MQHAKKVAKNYSLLLRSLDLIKMYLAYVKPYSQYLKKNPKRTGADTTILGLLSIDTGSYPTP